MAEITTHKGSTKKRRQKKFSTRIDFTPMCDLGFLLITFFMLSTSLNKPQTMEISMPSKDKVSEEEQNKVKESTAVTLLLGRENRLYYYFGLGSEEKDPEVKITNYSPDGIRNVLLQRNEEVTRQIKEIKKQRAEKLISEKDYKEQSAKIKDNLKAPVVMIKSTDESTYENLVDILDEMAICNIGRYAIIDITEYDKELISKIENPEEQFPQKLKPE
jgi:biopolymer transport protein ExbD